MTISDLTRSRVDLFSDIHKGLRKALFDLSIQAGATDWDDERAVANMAAAWSSVVTLLRCHTGHEDDHIFRLLDGSGDAVRVPDDVHRDLDDLMEDLDARFTELRLQPDATRALPWYRDLNRYIAVTLEHLHVEETVVQPALWAARSDEELTACRNAFLAVTPPSVMETTVRALRGALSPATLRTMGLAE